MEEIDELSRLIDAELEEIKDSINRFVDELTHEFEVKISHAIVSLKYKIKGE